MKLPCMDRLKNNNTSFFSMIVVNYYFSIQAWGK